MTRKQRDGGDHPGGGIWLSMGTGGLDVSLQIPIKFTSGLLLPSISGSVQWSITRVAPSRFVGYGAYKSTVFYLTIWIHLFHGIISFEPVIHTNSIPLKFWNDNFSPSTKYLYFHLNLLKIFRTLPEEHISCKKFYLETKRSKTETKSFILIMTIIIIINL